MDIHKPKPVHNLREFLSEIGVVVCGVLIALGAEQSIEWLHWRHEVEVERRSLLAEAQDALNVIGSRQAEQACVDGRLNQVHILIQRHEYHQPLKILRPMGAHIRDAASLGTWQIALSGQALAHMIHDERLRFSSAFGSYQAWDEDTKKEATDWAGLAPLQEPDLLDDQDWSRLKSAYWDAEQINSQLQRFAKFVVKTQNLGLRRGLADPEVAGFTGANAAMCSPFVDLK